MRKELEGNLSSKEYKLHLLGSNLCKTGRWNRVKTVRNSQEKLDRWRSSNFLDYNRLTCFSGKAFWIQHSSLVVRVDGRYLKDPITTGVPCQVMFGPILKHVILRCGWSEQADDIIKNWPPDATPPNPALYVFSCFSPLRSLFCLVHWCHPCQEDAWTDEILIS